MEIQKRARGMRINTINYFVLLLTSILYGFLLYGTMRAPRRYQEMITATQDHVRCEQLASMVMQGSDILTEQVHLYTVTARQEYADAYFQEAYVDQRRERSLQAMEQYHDDDKVHEYLQAALEYSDALMEREIYAMRLVSAAKGYSLQQLPEGLRAVELTEQDRALSAQEQMERAQEMVFGDGYRENKLLIQNDVKFCLDSILKIKEQAQRQATAELNRSVLQQRVCIGLLFAINAAMFCFVAVLIVRPLRAHIKYIGENRELKVIGSYEFKDLALIYNNIYRLNAETETVLRQQAEQDALTNVLNRGSFQKLAVALKDCPTEVTFLMVDVDNFKRVNDTCGHAAGDLALKRVAKELTDAFRSKDYIARLGGDEFCVVMTESGRQQRPVIAQKIEKINRALLEIGQDGAPPVSVSVGVAFSERGFGPELYQKADEALYQAKEKRRGCCFYEEPAVPPAGEADETTQP